MAEEIKLDVHGIAVIEPKSIAKVSDYQEAYFRPLIVVAWLLILLFLIVYVACAYGVKIDPLYLAIGMMAGK